MSDDLFDRDGPPAPGERAGPGPLADRIRPRTFDELVGQDHLFEPGAIVPVGTVVIGTIVIVTSSPITTSPVGMIVESGSITIGVLSIVVVGGVPSVVVSGRLWPSRICSSVIIS